MNAEIIKAMQEADKPKKKQTFKKWWRKNEYIILRILFFPLWIGIILKDKISNVYYKKIREKNNWSEVRATEILNYYIPKYAEYNKEDKSFYFFDNGLGWGIAEKKIIKRKDRNFWILNKWEIRSFLINKYGIEGFTKEVGNCWDGWTEITFTLAEK